MSGPLLSENWYRVAHLRPHLRPQVRVKRQRFRHQIWYQLVDTGSGRHHRLNQSAYLFIGRLNGDYTVAEVWNELVHSYGDEALTQDDAIRVLGQLNNAELLQCQLTPNIEALFRQHKQQTRRKRWMELNPLAIRVRLFDPSRWLALFDSWLPTLFRPASFALWLMVVIPALLIAAEHWVELRAFATAHVQTPRYLLIAWLAYPFVKLIHELGHALAVRRWGGQVHDVGFTAFVLVPVPYVDASAATGFPRRSQRALVSGIGIMVELFLAALALYLWLNVQPGLVQDTAFVVMLITSVSTLVFNGNPLLRFDGYHLFCDLLDLPNLDARSKSWWHNLLQRRLFHRDTPALPLAAGERKWMALYAPLAWSYRFYIGVLIALWAGAKFALLGLVIIIAVIVSMLMQPIKSMAQETANLMQGRARQRAKLVLGGLMAAVILLVTLIPLPYGTMAPAVVSLPDEAQVRAGTDGFVSGIMVKDGDMVVPGQVLAVLDDPDLIAGQTAAQNRLMGLHAQQYNALTTDRLRAVNLTEVISHAEAEAVRLDARVAQLEIRSQIAGKMVMVRQDDVLGTWLKKGQLLGYVLGSGEFIVRAVVAHQDAPQILQHVRSTEIRLEERPTEPLSGQIRRTVPAATNLLPSAALADQNGGTLVTDPADAEHMRTLEPVFLIDVALPNNRIEHIGGRAQVRFNLGMESLIFQWAYRLNQLFLQHLDGAQRT